MDERVYETLMLELGAAVLECFDSDMRIKTRAGQAEAITEIRQRYGSPRSGKEDERILRYRDRLDSPNGDHRSSERVPCVQAS